MRLELQQLTKRYGGHTVIDGITATLDFPHVLALLGPSGGGKTCLLDILAGRKNVGHTSGTRLVDGVPVPVAAPTAADACVGF